LFKHPKILTAAALTLAASCPSLALHAADAAPNAVAMAVADGGRTPWDVMRDTDRKPAAVLAFSQIKPGMVVVDLVPGDAYYTRMLAALVGPKGHVYAIVPFGGGGGTRSSRISQRLAKAPGYVPADQGEQCVLGCYPTEAPPTLLPVDNVLALENTDEYAKNVTVLWEALESDGGNLAIPQQADAVFTADGYHELHYKKFPALPSNMKGRSPQLKALDNAAFNKSMFRTLKPGGILVVVDYAAAKGAGFDGADTLHRTESDAVKGEITAAGFAFDGESNALALTSDDHTKPAIGAATVRDKTDQFILRFKKPANAPNTDKRPTKAQEDAILKNYYGNTLILNPQSKAVSDNGQRTRTSYYNADHTYQEFGRLADGPGPMQAGTWWWDADGHNCELHQFPIDERSNVVCHIDVIPREIGVLAGQTAEGGGQKTTIVKGHILKDYIIP
jgi:predicted methyltransferase